MMASTTVEADNEDDMVKVIYVEADGTERVLEGEPGYSVMEVGVRGNVVGIEASCGGACACATCHVYVDADWLPKVGEPEEMEQDMLEFAGSPRENSRLSCQIRLTAALDGLRVSVPDSQH